MARPPRLRSQQHRLQFPLTGEQVANIDDMFETLFLGLRVGTETALHPAADTITGILPVEHGGTGTATAFTPGSVVFAGPAGVYAEDNANLFWDDTNNFLGVGTATPTAQIHAVAASGLVSIAAQTLDGAGSASLVLSNDIFASARLTFYGSTVPGTYGFTSFPLAGLFAIEAIGDLVISSLAGDFLFDSPGDVIVSCATVELARFDGATGNVGIGTTAFPTVGERGLVFGVSVPLSAGAMGADTAGLYAVSDGIGPGTVRMSAIHEDSTGGTIATLTQLFLPTAGSVMFAGATGSLSQDNASFFWDDTKNSLGIGTVAFPSTGTFGLVFGDGTALATMASNTAAIYANDVAGTVTMFGINEAGVTGALAMQAAAFTTGSVLFAGSTGLLTQDNANFFWDDTNNRLGIGTAAPAAILDASGGNNAYFYFRASTGQPAIRLVKTDTSTEFLIRYLGTSGVALELGLGQLHVVIDPLGKVGIGVSAPTAVLHLKAGTASANTAPLKFTSGTNLTTAEAGVMEYNGTNLFFTRAGTVRENVLVAIDNVAAPTTNAGTPTTRYGGDTKYLGDPNRWLSVNVLGSTYKIPLYN